MTNTNKLMIEYVCTGNNGRSPMAEAIALDYVHRKGLEDRIEICSSGSRLHELTKATGEAYLKQQLWIIDLALKNGIYQESWRQTEAGKVLTEGKEMMAGTSTDAGKSLSKSYESVRDALEEYMMYAVNVEAMFRNMALFEKGLVAGGKYHKSTEARHSGLILPMAESNAAEVRTIYERSAFAPRVEPLNVYAGLEGEVTNPFCQLLPTYQATREDLMRSVPISIEKAVEEHL